MAPKNSVKKQQKKDTLKNLYAYFEGSEIVLDTFESGIFPINKIEGTGFSDLAMSDKLSDHSNLKIVTPKKML